MKRIGGLIALLACATVGGVYATWSYAANDDIGDQYVELTLGLAGYEQEGANGTYAITSNVTFSIDQQEGSDHVAEIRMITPENEEPYITVTFTPSASASVDIKENGVPTEVCFTTGGAFQYKMDANGNYDANGTATNVLTLFNPPDGTFSPNVTWTPTTDENGDNVFSVTYDAEDLATMVKLSGNFVLDTYAEYTHFRDALLSAGSLIVKVTDGIIPAETTSDS